MTCSPVDATKRGRSRLTTRRLFKAFATIAAFAVIVPLLGSTGAAAGAALPRSHFFPLALQHRLAPGAQPSAPNAGTVDCVNRSNEPNVNMDCKTTVLPNNELNIAVDPNDPDHMVASSNDYESCCDEFYTSFDGGKTWASGDISTVPADVTGSDPVSVISKKTGTVFHASLNFANDGSFSDVVDSRSTDGGLTWDVPQVVRMDTDPTVFNDKEWIAVDNYPASPYYGRLYVTWTRFTSTNSPIWMSYSDDDGLTWSSSMEISGNNRAICTYHGGVRGAACDSDQFSVPSVGPDGAVFVNFVNDQNKALWEPGEMFDDQILVVVSMTGGTSWSRPAMAAALEDGNRDYPINVDGRQTLTGLQLRLGQNTSGVAGTTPGTVYVVWSDNRNGLHDSDHPVTNSDVFVATSRNYGRTWSEPLQVSSGPADQWQAWMDVNPVTGRLGIVYFDRGYGDPALYDITLASIAGAGPINHRRVTTESSNPTDSVFFRAGIRGCGRCTRFNGDYNGIAFGADGSANIAWTDMRDVKGGHGHLEHGYFARL
jgi:hypothetical protein